MQARTLMDLSCKPTIQACFSRLRELLSPMLLFRKVAFDVHLHLLRKTLCRAQS